MNYTDISLKQALAKMLPEKVSYETNLDQLPEDLYWIRSGHTVLDTELLHLCWLVEETLDVEQMDAYEEYFNDSCETVWRAAWQQRVQALAAVKGVEIV